MPFWLNGVVVMHQSATVLVGGHPYVIQEEERVVAELRLGLQEMSQGAEGGVDDGRHGHDAEGLGMRVTHKVDHLGELPEPPQQHESCQQMRPDIECFVVLLEEGEEVEGPAPVEGSVAGLDVGLPEKLGHVGCCHCAGWSRQGLGQNPRDFAQVLEVDEEVAEFFGYNRCHDRKVRDLGEGGEKKRDSEGEQRKAGRIDLDQHSRTTEIMDWQAIGRKQMCAPTPTHPQHTNTIQQELRLHLPGASSSGN